MQFNITHDGRTTLAVDYQGAVALGYPAAAIGAAMKVAAGLAVTAFADSYRTRLSSASAGKLAEWRFKEEIVRDLAKAEADELAILDREAAARGIDRAMLMAGIVAKATAYRQIALLIGALEAEANAAIFAIADDAPDIEAQIETTLIAASGQADTAFNEATQLFNGGA